MLVFRALIYSAAAAPEQHSLNPHNPKTLSKISLNPIEKPRQTLNPVKTPYFLAQNINSKILGLGGIPLHHGKYTLTFDHVTCHFPTDPTERKHRAPGADLAASHAILKPKENGGNLEENRGNYGPGGEGLSSLAGQSGGTRITGKKIRKCS